MGVGTEGYGQLFHVRRDCHILGTMVWVLIVVCEGMH